MKDLREAMRRVENAKPVIARLLKGGELMAVEGADDAVCRMLDMTCGTDYFQVYDGLGLVWGIASRMQVIDTTRYSRPFDTFTVRKARDSGTKTEYEKRRDAIRHGGVYPYLTMQGYVDGQTDELMSLGIARTTDIMDYVDRGFARVKHTGPEQRGQAEFYIVDWEHFESAGYDIRMYHA